MVFIMATSKGHHIITENFVPTTRIKINTILECIVAILLPTYAQENGEY
jgi:hypothetical protein